MEEISVQAKTTQWYKHVAILVLSSLGIVAMNYGLAFFCRGFIGGPCGIFFFIVAASMVVFSIGLFVYSFVLLGKSIHAIVRGGPATSVDWWGRITVLIFSLSIVIIGLIYLADLYGFIEYDLF